MPKIELIEEIIVHGGTQQRFRHQSDTLKCPMVFTLFLPERANEGTDLVWFLSGLTCNDQNFATKGAFQQKANELNLAIVIPDTSPRGEEIADDENYDLGQGAGFYLNATAKPWAEHFQMYDYITEELSAVVKDLMPNFTGVESIMGHSMGGYGALQIGLKNSDRFKSISAYAPISNPTQVPWGQKAFTNYLGDNQSTWAEWDIIAILEESKADTPILVTQGDSDNFYPEQLKETAFVEAAEKSNHSLDYKMEAGYDHSYYTIQTFIGDHLEFHKNA